MVAVAICRSRNGAMVNPNVCRSVCNWFEIAFKCVRNSDLDSQVDPVCPLFTSICFFFAESDQSQTFKGLCTYNKT